MFKQIYALCIAVVVLAASTNAFASRAHTLVMGSGDPFSALGNADHGSFYEEDNYNVFYNPSYANEFKNWAAIEKTNTGGNAVGTGSAEGGAFGSFMNFAFGAFFNRGDAAYNGGSIAGYNAAARPIDLVFAGDTGVKWGLGLTHFQYKPAAGDYYAEQTVHGGVQYMNFEPFGFYKIRGVTRTAGAQSLIRGYMVGLKYHWGEWIPYAAWRKDTQKDSVGTNTVAHSSIWGVGLGRNAKLTEATKLAYSVSYWQNPGTTHKWAVPVDVAFEGDALSWLTLRAGFNYRLFNVADGYSAAQAPTGRFGASFHVAKLDIDWAVGGTEADAKAGANVDSNNFDVSHGFFTAASATYRW